MTAIEIISAKNILGIGGEYKIVKDWVYNKKNSDKSQEPPRSQASIS